MLILGLFGCGVMGRRHILGLKKLRDAGRLRFELAGVCDLIAGPGQQAADLAADLLGRRPQVFTSLDQMRRALGQLDAIAITTAPDSHVMLGVEALRLTQRRDGVDAPVPEAELLAQVPDFALDATTAALFGGERLAMYGMEWADIDANLLAIEYNDFAAAIVSDRQPEVAGADGLRALAVVYGFLESERLGRAVGVDELLGGARMP